jgi:hypothetical protein
MTAMIVQVRGSSLYLITQPDHAALSERVMTAWRAQAFDQRSTRNTVLLAVREHDNGWREPDASPILDGDTGRILDFMTVAGAVRRAIWPRGVERLSREPWAAALVAQHAMHVYRRYRGDAEWNLFFEQMETARARHLHAAGSRSVDDLLFDYFFVRMGDLISLTFCNTWTDVQEESDYEIRLEGTRVRIHPDPFKGAVVPIEITARELPNRSFGSTSEAARLFASARQVTLAGIVSG